MKCQIRPASVVLIAVLALLAPTLTACAKGDAQPTEASPPYCASQDGGPDAHLPRRLVEQSCRVATDGDFDQARALRRELTGLDAEQVAAFHRTFVRVSKSLYTQEAGRWDQVCAPGIGLGDDLFTDFRSWVIAHGKWPTRALSRAPRHSTIFQTSPTVAGWENRSVTPPPGCT